MKVSKIIHFCFKFWVPNMSLDTKFIWTNTACKQPLNHVSRKIRSFSFFRIYKTFFSTFLKFLTFSVFFIIFRFLKMKRVFQNMTCPFPIPFFVGKNLDCTKFKKNMDFSWLSRNAGRRIGYNPQAIILWRYYGGGRYGWRKKRTNQN